MATLQLKICTLCKKKLPIKDFYKRGDAKGNGYMSRCKKCCSKASYASLKKNSKKYKAAVQRHKKWRASEKGKLATRNYSLKSLCGSSVELYEKLLIKQDYRCAVCGTHQSHLVKALHQDHNHLNGQIRGLLCFKCNAALGFLNCDESNNNLITALEYMEKYK